MQEKKRATRHEQRVTTKCGEYAVIGWPLGHSMSPPIHNAAFRALGLPCRFISRPVSPAGFSEFMEWLPSSGFAGLAVTIPYKTRVLRYGHGRDARVEAIGAANTVRVGEGGRLDLFNTDAGAVGRSLRAAGADPAAKRIVVLGAGGAARAVCFQILWDGAAALTIANRTLSRAERLRNDLLREEPSRTRVAAVPLEKEALSSALRDADILINTTSVGMYPRVGESPVPAELLRAEITVFDIIYNPAETRLIREARAKGAKVIVGTDMLVYQAVEQERIWIGVEAPAGVMKEVLLRELARSP